MKKQFVIIFAAMIFLQTLAFAQRPEAMYVHRAMQKKNIFANPNVQGRYVQPPLLFNNLLEDCPQCDEISFNAYTPNPTYISVYGSDSVWVNTYVGTVPDLTYTGSYLNFEEGCLNFMHYTDNTWAPMSYWDGFTVSKTTTFPCDTACIDPCLGLESQFSSITGGGVNGATDPYTVAYYGYNQPANYLANHCVITLDQANTICGMYVTNNAYAHKLMKCGSGDFGVGRKFVFGDSLMLRIKGYNNGAATGSVDYYLADFTNIGTAYIVDEWKWVNLLPLGTVDSIAFELVTSDVGFWGPNTPMYFCMDEIKVGTELNCGECPETDNSQNWFPTASFNRQVTSELAVSVSPNPVSYEVSVTAAKGCTLKIVDENGNIKHSGKMEKDKVTISTRNYKKGIYYVTVTSENASKTVKLLKE